MLRRILPAVLPLALLAASGCAKEAPKAPDAPPPTVLVSLPVSDDYTEFEDFIGQTGAVYDVTVTARVTGYLDRVGFEDGAEVKKGDLLFAIDQRPYKAELDRVQSTWQQGEAHLKRLDLDHRRAQNLMIKGAMAREEFDKIQGDFDEAVAMVGIAKAQLDTAQLNQEWTEVRAPIDGRLSRRMVDPGNLIKADDTQLTTIVSLDPIYAYFDVDERTLLRLRRLIREGKVQSRAEAEVPILVGLADEEGYPHKALINFSDNRIDTGTGTLRLRGVLDNPPQERGRPRVFSPGLFVRVRLPVGKPHTALFVKELAIRTDQGKKFVNVVTKGPIKSKVKGEPDRMGEVIAYRQVKVGPLVKGMRVIEEGLAPDDRIVVGGLQRVRQGGEVVPKFADEAAKPAVADATKPEPAKPEPSSTTLAVGLPPAPIAPAPATKPPGH